MEVTKADARDICLLLNALQTFEDSQIRCKGLASSISAMKANSTVRAVEYLERLVGVGKMTNRNVGKILNQIHPYLVEGAKSGLGIYDSAH